MATPLDELIQQLQIKEGQTEIRVPEVPLANIERKEQQRIVESDPEGYKQIIYDPIPQQSISRKKSLTELASDKEFAERAERFLKGIGSNDNIFEYLRDADYSLSSAIVRSFQTGNWTEEQKQDYVYLKNQFDNAELKGFKERFGAFKDITVDLVADPLNLLAAIFTIPTGGGSLAAGAAGSAATRVALTQAGKAAVSKMAKAQTLDKLKGAALDKAVQQGALYGAAEGAAWGGLHNYFLQDIDIDLGQKEAVDLTDIGVSTLFGSLIGGSIVGGARGISSFRRAGETNEKMTPTLKQKEFEFSNEDAINKTGDSMPRSQVVEESELDEVIENLGGTSNPESAKNTLNLWISRTIGKPVTEFVGYVKRAPALKNLLASVRYDYDTTLGKGQKGVQEIVLTDGTVTNRAYGEALGDTNGFFQFGLAKALNVLYRVGFRARIFGKQEQQLAYLLRDENIQIRDKKGKVVTAKFIDDFTPSEYVVTTRNGKSILGTNYAGFDIDEDVIDSFLQIKQLLNKAYMDGKAGGIFKPGTGRVINYLPRMFKHSVLSNKQKRAEFEQKLIDSGHADPINEKEFLTILDSDGNKVRGVKEDALGIDEQVFGRNFLEEAGQDIEQAKKLKANAIVQDMLDYKHTPLELRLAGKRGSNATGFLQPRRFRNLKDNEISEFLEDDVQTLLENYFTNFSQTLNRAKYFGKTLAEVEANKINPIRNELMKSGMSADEATKVVNSVRGMITRVTGLETYADSPLKTNKYFRFASDWGKLSQQMAHLPFATLSSITEPLLLLSRAGKRDAPLVGRDILKALGKQTQSFFDRTIKGFQRGVLRKKTRNIKDLNDEEWSELYKTGLALEQAVQERLEGLVGEGIYGSRAKLVQQGFFKVNLLTQWTKAVQLASFTTGKRLIQKNAEQLAKGGLSKSKTTYLKQQLNDLGIYDDQAVAWYKKYTKDGKFDFDAAKADEFYQQDITKGANRFVKEIILNPSTAEANRPLWFSTPAAQMLVQFAGYPTVFNNTILKRFAYETKNSPMQAMPKIIPTVLLMTTVAHIGNTLRSNGANYKDYETGLTKDDGQLFFEAVRRWGGTGPFDYAQRYMNEKERDVGFIANTLKPIAGPLPQDILDGILYRKGLAELVATNLPGYQAYDLFGGEGTKKELRRIARGSAPEKEKVVFFAKGGLVYNVPNVTDEPDEMQSRITGEPFNATAEFVQDEEDRALRGQMSRLGFQEGGSVEDEVQKKHNQNKLEVYFYLKEKGLREEAIIGIMANIGKETYDTYSFETKQINGPGYGLFQLDPGGDHVTQYNMFLERNERQDSMEAQIDYFLESIYDTKSPALKSNGSRNARDLRNLFDSGTVEEITQGITEKWERPKDYLESKKNPEDRAKQLAYQFNLQDRIVRAEKLKNDIPTINEDFSFINEEDVRYLPGSAQERIQFFKSINNKIYLPRNEAETLNYEINAQKLSEGSLRNDPQGRGFHGGDPEYDPISITNDPAEIKGREGIDEYGTRPKIYRALNQQSALFSDKYYDPNSNISQYEQGKVTSLGLYNRAEDEMLLSSTEDNEGKEVTEPHEYMHRGLLSQSKPTRNPIKKIARGIDNLVYNTTGGNVFGTYATDDQEHAYINEAIDKKQKEDFQKKIEDMSIEELEQLKKELEEQKEQNIDRDKIKR